MTKRLPLLTVASLIAVFVVVGLSGRGLPITAQGTPAVPAQRPVVTATLPDGTEVQGTLLSACWEQTDPAKPSCVFPIADQLAAISIAAGAQISFAVTPDSPIPAAFGGTLTEANAPGGTAGRNVELRATLGMYNANIDPGEYILQAIASYPAPDSGEYYVEYGFRLTVTAPPTQVPLPTNTLESATSEPAPATATQDTVPTQEIATTVPPTDTALPPTATATPVPPTATSTATATPLPTLTPTNTPLAPDNVVRAGGRDFSPLRTTVTFRSAEGDDVTISRPNVGSNTLRIEAAAGAIAQIEFLGERPANVEIELLSADGTNSLSVQDLPGDSVIVYIMPAQAGSYVLAIKATYENRIAIYFYRLAISG